MRFLIQRVNCASVSVDGKTVGEIQRGLLVLIGINNQDNEQIADKMIRKLIGMRIFEDENKKTNLDLAAVDGGMLLVSQFTLYADCRKGNRPSFVHAGEPHMAQALYQYIVSQCRQKVAVVEQGIFGADMKIALENDGPFTVLLDSDELSA